LNLWYFAPKQAQQPVNALTEPNIDPADLMPAEPLRIPPEIHGISTASIHPGALKVLHRLDEAGFQACLVGGCVRDLLLGREPKDFDVATDASPEQVRKLFRSARIIGRRFRLVHVRHGRDIIEVATFRAPHHVAEDEAQALVEENGRILRDNVYGTLETDVWRRDFTINALYYDIRDHSILDFTGGMTDLAEGRLRLLGDPATRYREDPVRMLRAVRFATKLGFRLDPDAEAAIHELHPLIAEVSPARLFEEVLKLMHGGCALQTFEALRHYGLFAHLFPAAEAHLNGPDGEAFGSLINAALANTDRRIAAGQPVTPAFLVAVLLWGPVRARAAELEAHEGMPPIPALQEAAQEVLHAQQRSISIPRRFTLPAREIWALQLRLPRTSGKRPLRLLSHPRFRAGYDFLCLRAQSAEPELAELCQWWTEFQQQAGLPASPAPEARPEGGERPRRRRRPRRRKPRSGQ